MTRPVTVVLPCLDDFDLFEKNLPPLLAELESRALEDEVLVVDDTGEDVLAAWLGERFPSVRVHAMPRNSGFAVALLEGVRRATHELVFCMNPDVLVRPGFLDPLVACMEDLEVHSVVPRVLLHGVEDAIESITEVHVFRGLGEVRQRGLDGDAHRFRSQPLPVAYAVGGTCLLRRSEFVDAGGFDALYEPFYWEDVDLGWAAWREGRRVVYQPASVVEHHHRGTIGRRVPRDLVRAVIERNRLLFQWKFIDTPETLERHVAALYRWAVDGWLRNEREELVWLVLALESAERALASRSGLGHAVRDFEAIRRAVGSALDRVRGD